MDDETRDDKQPLTIAPGFLRGLKGERTEWPVVCKELIDNSLDANAKNISIRICDGSFVIDDDGEGCADLIAMESIGRSIKLKHTKSGMYGYGGVMAQIRISQGGDVKVESTSREWRSRVIIDFFECIENDRFETKGFQRRPSPPKVNTGTKITIEDAKPFYMKQRGDLIDNLSHSYSSALKRGKKIVVEINEEKTVLAPFNAPLFDGDHVDTTFEYQGHNIRLICGVVKEGVKNRYSGWSVYWGQRIVKVTGDPVGGHGSSYRRVYGEVYLPDTWKNINTTKDDFTEDVTDLWETIGDLCSDVISRADQQTTDVLFRDASEAVGDMLTRAIGIKGRRPNRNGESGTRQPTGEGSSHENFRNSQSGDKTGRTSGGAHSKIPDRVRVAFDESLEQAYVIETGGTRNRTMTITLNKDMPQVFHFRKDPIGLATLCCAYIAHHIFGNREYDGLFDELKVDKYHDIHGQLLARVMANCPAEVE